MSGAPHESANAALAPILIAVATCERPLVTEITLTNLRDFKGPRCALLVYDDASTRYGRPFLMRFADEVIRMPQRGGIERLRARNFRDFVTAFGDAALLYTTDNDVVHDPGFAARLRALHALGAGLAGGPLPVSLYRSRFHESAANVLWTDPGPNRVSLRGTAPGVSQLYDRAMAETILAGYAADPGLETRYGYDYHLPALLGRPFLQSDVSYLEHFARDAHEAGLHSTNRGGGSDALADFERDRALEPTPWLARIRPMVIDAILAQARAGAPEGVPR